MERWAVAFCFPPPSDLELPFLLDGLGVEHPQEPVRRPLGYPLHQWIQVLQGSLELRLGDEVVVARVGDGVYLQPDEPHAYHGASREPAVVNWICWHGSGVSSVLTSSPLRVSGVYRLTDTTALDRLWDRAWTIALTAPGTVLSALIYELIMNLTEAAAVPGLPSREAGWGRVGPVLARIREQLDAPWTVAQMASVVELSPQHLGRLFRQTLGVPPLRYLNQLRLGRAQQLLIERPNLRIHEVALAVGFDDVNYFVRMFRRRRGQTPGEFRQLHR